MTEDGIKLKDLCDRLDVDYDEARYTLARGELPKEVAKAEPGRGKHRQFNHGQAFYLAVVLKLKLAGIPTPLAVEMSEWSRRVQTMSVNLGWDRAFAPFNGKLHTSHEWYVDVGDARFVRIVTDSKPGGGPRLHVEEWVDVRTHRPCPTAQPSVIIRVDVALIARQLIESEAEKRPS